MPEATHRFAVGSFVEIQAPNGSVGTFRIVEHRELEESYILRSRHERRNCQFNLTAYEATHSTTYQEPDPW